MVISGSLIRSVKRLNLFFRKLSWKAGLPLVAILLSIWPLCSFFATRPLVNLEVLPVSAMGVYPLQKHIPVKKIKKKEISGRDLLSIRLYDKLPHAWDICFLHDKTKQDLIVRIIWIDPCGLFGQFDCFYEITSPDVRAELLNFIVEHESDLRNQRLQCMMGYMIRHYRPELSKLGDGDPYVGLERAGVADWIKEGKDPEAEWEKRFPADGERP